MREEGAGIVETAIAMSLVGVLVMVSVASLGGGIRSYTTSHVVPVVGGGAHPDGGEDVQGESSSSTPSAQSPLLSVQVPEFIAQGPLDPYDASYSSGGSSSSIEWQQPFLNPNFDWSTVSWEDAVAAGIVTNPDPDDVGPISLNESDNQSSSSTDWDWPSELSLGSWCTSQDGTSYFSTEPCPDLINDWESSRVAGGVAPPIISWCQDENGNSYMQENGPCSY